MKVFVVEDNPVYCKYVCNLLAREGFETETASSLSAARKLADKMESEDIILADLRLPDGECTGLLQWMRNQGKRQRFIVMTDYAEVHTAVESMKLGSEDYIPKRLIEERLLPLVQTIRKEQERTGRERNRKGAFRPVYPRKKQTGGQAVCRSGLRFIVPGIGTVRLFRTCERSIYRCGCQPQRIFSGSGRRHAVSGRSGKPHA